MICIPIIAGEGGSDNAKKLEKGLAGRCLTMRGGRSPLCTPQAGAFGPHSPHGWAYPAHTWGSFRFTTKGTKGVPGLRPWTP